MPSTKKSDRKSRKELYTQKLRDPRWQKKRLEIMERDDWKCRGCGDTEETLNVHHLVYNNETGDPWDVPSDSLITLCEACHNEEPIARSLSEKVLLESLRERGYVFDDFGYLISMLAGVPRETVVGLSFSCNLCLSVSVGKDVVLSSINQADRDIASYFHETWPQYCDNKRMASEVDGGKQ